MYIFTILDIRIGISNDKSGRHAYNTLLAKRNHGVLKSSLFTRVEHTMWYFAEKKPPNLFKLFCEFCSGRNV